MKYSLPTGRSIAAVSLLCAGVLFADCGSARAQSFLDRIGQQVEQEIRRAVEPSRKQPSGGNSQIKPLNSLPGESGSRNIPGESGGNNGNSRFNPNGFFVPNTQPRTTQPRQTYPRQTYPQQTYPRQTYPQNDNRATASPPRTSDVSNLELKILSPSSMPRNVSYWLQTGNSQFEYTIPPGHSQRLVESRVWMIHFLQSGREIVYRLRGGKVYEFDVDRDGRLQLYEVDPQPVNIAPEPPRRGR